LILRLRKDVICFAVRYQAYKTVKPESASELEIKVSYKLQATVLG
jgi:hypothetical protein